MREDSVGSTGEMKSLAAALAKLTAAAQLRSSLAAGGAGWAGIYMEVQPLDTPVPALSVGKQRSIHRVSRTGGVGARD